MMDKEKILKEGLLEQYILGDLDPSIQNEVEKAIQDDSSLKQMLQQMEQDFEQLSMENAVAPPTEIKADLLASISQENKQSEVIPLISNKYKAWFSLAAAASVILFLNTIFLIVQNGDIKQQLSKTKSENFNLKETQQSIQTSYDDQQMLLAFLSDPETEQYALIGNSKMPEVRLVSYVNHDEKTVMINTSQLSELDKDHDYQMWADVEGEMIDMGVIDVAQPLLAMNYIDHAESFNITIEPKGGSEHPTVSRLISNVYLK